QRPPGGEHHDLTHLRPYHEVVGAERTVAIAGDDTVVGGSLNFPESIVAPGYIVEGRRGRRVGRVYGQGGYPDHAPGHIATPHRVIRPPGAVRIARHEISAHRPAHEPVEPIAWTHVLIVPDHAVTGLFRSRGVGSGTEG